MHRFPIFFQFAADLEPLLGEICMTMQIVADTENDGEEGTAVVGKHKVGSCGRKFQEFMQESNAWLV